VFFAVAGSTDGAPRWLFLDGPGLQSVADLDQVCARLRSELLGDPLAAPFDDAAVELLDRALTVAARREFDTLPRRMRRALDQMAKVLAGWTDAARRAGNEPGALVLRNLADLARPHGADTEVDLYLVAERWLTLVAPTLDEYRRQHRNRPYVLLSDVTRTLVANPPSVETVVRGFSDLPALTPLAERVTACILGVSGSTPPAPRTRGGPPAAQASR
jgi:hypothetical protein